MLLGQRFLVLAVVSLLTLPILPAQTSYFSVTGNGFLEGTRFVFLGKLVDKVSYRDVEAGHIFTRHVFQVSEAVKGNPGDQVEVIEYGGTVDGETLQVSHGPSYVLGQEYLVFSYIDLLDHDRTLSGPLGQFQVVSDREGGKTIRLYPTHPLRAALKLGKAPVFMELDSFCDRVRNRLDEIGYEKE